MRGKVDIDHIWRHKCCRIIFSLEYSRSIIGKITHVFENGIEIDVIDPKDYPIYRKGERVYIHAFPGMQVITFRENKLKEYTECDH